jgi:hypothetical protein
MRLHARSTRRRTHVLLCALLATAGCSSAPDNNYCAVTGRVLLDGELATYGTVSYRPVDARQGHQPTGSISEAGTYTLYTSGAAGAPPGEYHVVVFINEAANDDPAAAHPTLPRSLIDSEYQRPEQTPLRVRVEPDAPPETYDLEVHREYRNPQ